MDLFIVCLLLLLTLQTLDDSDEARFGTFNALQEFLLLLYEQEAPPSGTIRCAVCATNGAAAYFRCLDCFGNRLQCGGCLRSSHFGTKGDPFHRVEKLVMEPSTNSFHFSRASLADPEVNGKLQCGHDGLPCPFQNHQDSTSVRIFDINGIFTYQVYHCSCIDKTSGMTTPLHHQFFRLRLFPATHDTIRTAFTFRSLEIAQMNNFCSASSHWDFYEMIRRRTDNVRSETVPVSLCVAGYGKHQLIFELTLNVGPLQSVPPRD